MTTQDIENLDKLKTSLDASTYKVRYEQNYRDTESLYRFGWFYINDYKYSVSGWAFLKGIVTFESEDGYKVKYSIPNKLTFVNEFKKDTFISKNIKKVRIKLSKWLKDLSDKLQP